MNRPMEQIMEDNQKEQDKINAQLEKGSKSEMKDIARAMVLDDKTVVLKTIPTIILLGEIIRRVLLLENRDKAMRELLRMPEE